MIRSLFEPPDALRYVRPRFDRDAFCAIDLPEQAVAVPRRRDNGWRRGRRCQRHRIPALGLGPLRAAFARYRPPASWAAG